MRGERLSFLLAEVSILKRGNNRIWPNPGNRVGGERLSPIYEMSKFGAQRVNKKLVHYHGGGTIRPIVTLSYVTNSIRTYISIPSLENLHKSIKTINIVLILDFLVLVFVSAFSRTFTLSRLFHHLMQVSDAFFALKKQKRIFALCFVSNVDKFQMTNE